jgi:hypothetical protein
VLSATVRDPATGEDVKVVLDGLVDWLRNQNYRVLTLQAAPDRDPGLHLSLIARTLVKATVGLAHDTEHLLRVELLEPHPEAGRIIDEHLVTTLPGCIVTSRGKFINVICHWSLGYTEDRIRTELKRLEATAVLLA